MADAWNEGTWGQGFWGQQSSVTVTLTGVSSTTALGTASATADVSVPPSPVTLTSTLGTPTAEPEHENIEFITNVSGLSMSTSLGTTTQSVGTGVIVSVTGLSMTSAAGTLEVSEATALVNPTALTMGAALSGASGITGEGNIDVIAPSDQLDFAIGTPVIDIFTQVDPVGVSATTSLGTAVAEADALVTLGSLSSSFTLGTETVEVGTGVIVSVSTVALTFAEGTETATGTAVVDITGLSMSIDVSDTFSTPWANVVTGASNTWTEVNAA
jgi:hypothetical protein